MAAGARRWSRIQKGSPARQRDSSLLGSARQLQALVRPRHARWDRSTKGICHSLDAWEQGRTVNREAAKEAVQLSGDPRQPVSWHSLEERECGPDFGWEAVGAPANVGDRRRRGAVVGS